MYEFSATHRDPTAKRKHVEKKAYKVDCLFAICCESYVRVTCVFDIFVACSNEKRIQDVCVASGQGLCKQAFGEPKSMQMSS